MIWSYLSTLSGLIATLISMVVGLSAFFSYRRAAIRCQQREARLPDATRFEDLRRQVVDKEQRLEDLKDEMIDAQDWVSRGRVARTEHARVEERIEGARADLDGLREQYTQKRRDAELEYGQKTTELQAELNSLNSKLHQEKQTYEQELVTARRAVDDEISTLNSKLCQEKETYERERAAAWRTVEGEIAELQEELALQKRKVESERESELIRTQSEYETKKAQIVSTFQEQTSEFTTQLDRLQRQVSEVNDELKRLLPKKEQLIEETEQLHRSHAEFKIEVDALRSEKAQLEKTIPQLQQLWKQLVDQTGGGSNADRTAELWQPVFTRTNLQQIVPEDGALNTVQEYLSSCGLRYSERILYAFHTSLKVADTSPLVVLAGISGTGKSELPRRYSEALGINFLNLAVQPRWDSPQDMFGFFNYLESRFRATELGRALVQMDSYGQEPGRGWPEELPDTYLNLSSQMLLVLLDEMNLARVEYYFSEFLSRLEIRRGIRVNDAHDRRKAEVPLEIGRTGLGSPTLNLFVGGNVLFVGTMNEDETTQSLSDKVMDRANVIRFGRPATLELARHDGTPEAASSQLQSENWNLWQQSPTEMPIDREQLEEWIQRLNQSMAIVKRPFAHRTSQAIRSYVANYPRADSNWLHHSMADQIEQKLLPKFRGLDPSEPEVRESLDKIRDIVDELEDGELRDAIQKSRVGHQFSWSGVDRAAAVEHVL